MPLIGLLLIVIVTFEQVLGGRPTHVKLKRKDRSKDRSKDTIISTDLYQKIPNAPEVRSEKEYGLTRKRKNRQRRHFSTETPTWFAEGRTIGLQIDNLLDMFSTEERPVLERGTETTAVYNYKAVRFRCCSFCNLVNTLASTFSDQISLLQGYGECNQHCKILACTGPFSSVTPTPSLVTDTASTFSPNRQPEIEIVTGRVKEGMLIREKQHCYQTIKSRDVTATDRGLCHFRYRPTSEGPRPSNRPLGLNVWTCCRNITNEYG